MIKRIRAFYEKIKLGKAHREKIKKLEKTIGLPVRHPKWYLKALRHRSFVVENGMDPSQSYEQLEFLGDAVLDLIVSEIILETYPESDEGLLTQLRSRLVKGETLAQIARYLQLTDFIELGGRVRNQGVEHTENVLEDVFEALVGAIFKDHGYSCCRNFVKNLYDKNIILDDVISTSDNYKSMLLELAQARRKSAPVYKIVRETGPGHQKIFDVEVLVDDHVLGAGTGRNKKKAEQEAAKVALESLKMI